MRQKKLIFQERGSFSQNVFYEQAVILSVVYYLCIGYCGFSQIIRSIANFESVSFSFSAAAAAVIIISILVNGVNSK